jgi:nuclear protein localization family protein 4
MSRNNVVTIGLRSSAGRRRLQIASSATGAALRNAIQKELGVEEDFVVRGDKNGKPGDEVKMTRTSTVAMLKIANGDVLYITPVAGTRFKAAAADEEEAAAAANGTAEAMDTTAAAPAEEDAVDAVLAKRDGRIDQPKTPNCQHKSTAQKCIYCTPKEPYDEEYLRKEGIKHMSFQSYLRKLSSGMDR